MTILEQYREKLNELRGMIEQGSLPLQELLTVQELSYRINVLETFQAYCRSAPGTMDTKAMAYHYQIVDAYMRFALLERQFGPKVDEEGKKKRETALESTKRVVLDGMKRFSSYTAGSPEQYKADISSYINTVLPVWMQYRNTYVNI